MSAYMDLKSTEAAKSISRNSGIDFDTAFRITSSVWEEARRCILAAAGTDEWQKLSFSDKAYVCRAVVKALLDKKRLAGFLSGERKSII